MIKFNKEISLGDVCILVGVIGSVIMAYASLHEDTAKNTLVIGLHTQSISKLEQCCEEGRLNNSQLTAMIEESVRRLNSIEQHGVLMERDQKPHRSGFKDE